MKITELCNEISKATSGEVVAQYRTAWTLRIAENAEVFRFVVFGGVKIRDLINTPKQTITVDTFFCGFS